MAAQNLLTVGVQSFNIQNNYFCKIQIQFFRLLLSTSLQLASNLQRNEARIFENLRLVSQNIFTFS